MENIEETSSEIDRYHSVPFHFHAGTNSLELQQLSNSVWQSFSPDKLLELVGTSNRKPKRSVEEHLELVVIQLFLMWLDDPTLCMATPRNKNAIRVNDFYNTRHINIEQLQKVFTALEEYEYVDKINHSYKKKGHLYKRWSQEFGPLVKMDFLMRKMIQNDEEKEPCA